MGHSCTAKKHFVCCRHQWCDKPLCHGLLSKKEVDEEVVDRLHQNVQRYTIQLSPCYCLDVLTALESFATFRLISPRNGGFLQQFSAHLKFYTLYIAACMCRYR